MVELRARHRAVRSGRSWYSPRSPTHQGNHPLLAESVEELRDRIPGWGADLDPATVLRCRVSGSMEHTQLPPVFGTTCPPKGLSGVVRKYAYAKYSEAQAAHWLLLMAGDRVDVLEHALRSFLTLRPDNPITQTGVLAEVKRHGLRSRLGHNRADVKHHWMDPLIVGAPWLGAATAITLAVRRLRGRR